MFKIFSIVCVFFFLLYDYYNPALGGRPFDLLGIVLLLIVIFEIISSFSHIKKYITPTHNILFVLNLVFWLFLGIIGFTFEQNTLSVVAFWSGAFIVLPTFYCLGIKYQSRLLSLFNFILVISLLFFLFQYAVYKIVGYPISFHSFAGFTQSRIYNEDLDYFRGAGIYQEPSEYSKASFLLLVLRVFINKKTRFDILTSITLFTLLLSNSLWGIGGLLFYVFFYAKSMVFRVSVIFFIVVTFLVIIENPDFVIRSGLLTDRTISRVLNPENDGSTVDRMGLETGNEINILTFVGHGLSTSKFQDYKGANGISFYIYSFGIFGFILLLLSIFIWGRDSILLILSLLYLMTAFPHFTYMVTWGWLGLCLSQISYHHANIKPPRFLEKS